MNPTATIPELSIQFLWGSRSLPGHLDTDEIPALRMRIAIEKNRQAPRVRAPALRAHPLRSLGGPFSWVSSEV